MSKDTLLAIKMDGFPLNKITSIIFFSLAVLSSSAVQAAEYEFDDAFLRLTSGRKIDVGRFKFGNPVEAGNYKVDVYLNKRFLVSDTVVIKKNDDDSSKVCLSPTLFSALRLREESLNEEALRLVKVEGYCVDAAELNPDIKATFSFADQQLNVEVPQALLHRSARGAVDPALWGSGVPAMILGYDANYYEAVSRNRESQSLYAGTRFGLNYDVWSFPPSRGR
jgi:P pilus assembly protein, porin PapC